MSMQFTSCNTQDEKTIEKWKQEVITTELNFSKMAGEKGITEAFLAFAADDAVLMRNHKIISGKNNLKTFLLKSTNPNLIDQKLKWAPDFVDVSASGDMAYTYGKFTFSYKDSIGKKLESKGIFHTVWKRQSNKEWKFVWD